MANLVKRTTADGQRRYDVRYRTPDGKVRNKTFRTLDAANAYKRTTEADLVRGSWVDPNAGRVTFGEYARQWVDNNPRLRPRTVELYLSQLKNHVDPVLGEVELGKITSATVRKWHSDLVKADKPGPVTVAKSYRLVRAIFTTAVEDDLIAKHPCILKGAGIERSPERTVATPGQVWDLADAVEPRFRALVLSAAFLGLRWGELVGLSRRHVDLLHRTVTVDRQLVESGTGTPSFGPPKSDAGVRIISIPAPLMAELEHHLSNYAGPGPDGLVFVGERGANLTRGGWHRKWSKARAAVDLPEGFHFHDLRHTSNTAAAATGASTRELMHRMGHSSPAAALRYQHATVEREVEIAAALGAVLDRPRDGRAMESESTVEPGTASGL